MVHSRRGAAAIVALVTGSMAMVAAPLQADAAMIRLPVGTQRMQMPLDCEAASLTIALASVGVHTTQQYVQSHFPTDTRAPVLGADGLPARWGDPYTAFVGHVMGSEPGSNPHWASYAGWGAYSPVVARAAESFGVPVAAQLSGWNPQALYAAVEAGHPVLVWSTVNYSSQTARHWTAWDGRTVPWTKAGHVVVLMGVDPTAGTLEFSDPLTGSYNGTTMAQFARTFTIYGSMAIVIERTAHAAAHRFTLRKVITPVHPAMTGPPSHPARWMANRHVRAPVKWSDMDGASGAGMGIGLLTSVTAAAPRADVRAPFAAGGLVLAAVAVLGTVVLRRRRRPCAG